MTAAAAAAAELSDEKLYEKCFEGLDGTIPPRSEGINEIISGRLFLRHLARSDGLFNIMFEDNKDVVMANKSPEQSMKNWRIVQMCLDDHGLAVSDEVTFSIIAGQLVTAHQLVAELRGLAEDPDDGERIVLHRVGPVVPVRQRINPFLPQPAAGERKGGTFAASAAAQPTRVFVHDSQRYMKKRMHLVEQIERLKEKELKAQRLREKKEREAAQRAQEALKKKELAVQQQAQEQYIKETMLLHKADPGKVAEKQKKSELLTQLEILESAFTADQRKLLKLKKEAHVESPRATTTSPERRPKSPQRIRVASSIPFSKHERKKENSTGWK